MAGLLERPNVQVMIGATEVWGWILRLCELLDGLQGFFGARKPLEVLSCGVSW